MDPTIQINERVAIVATYKQQGLKMELCMPCKMRWQGREVEFTELALRFPTIAGKRMIHVFHMSDGINGYRIEFDAEALTWTLISIISGEDHA